MRPTTLNALALLAHWRAGGCSRAYYENVPKPQLMMTIRDERKFEKEENGKQHHRLDRSYGTTGSVARL